MKLIREDPNARDFRYHNIQKLDWLSPPNTALLHLEELYEVSKQVLDKHFQEEIKHNFCARYAELYFAATLIDRLALQVSHPSDRGLDFYIENLNCWAEVVEAKDGHVSALNSLTKPELDNITTYPEEKIILRLTNAFTAKAEKARADIDKGVVASNQPIIICVSGGGMEERMPLYPEEGYPQIAKAVLPIGDLVYWIGLESRTVTHREFKYRDVVSKLTTSGPLPIKTDYFLDERYSHISAVIYSWANAWNPISRERWGADFHLVHNPFAKNKLSPGAIPCGQEYLVSASQVAFTMHPVINHEKS